MLLKARQLEILNFVLPIHCGTEIGVASTKAFLGQILNFIYFSIKSWINGEMIQNKKIFEKKLKDLKELYQN